MKKSFCVLTALLLLLTVCGGCGSKDQPSGGSAPAGIYYDITGIDPREAVLEYDGNSIPAELYLYMLGSYCDDTASQLNMFSAYYGMYTELVNEDGSIVWDGALDDTTPNRYVTENTEANSLFYMVLENTAKEYGVSITEADKAEMEELLAQQIEQSGGQEAFEADLEQAGISRETFDRIIMTDNYLLEHLQTLAADPSSDLYEAPSDDNAYVDHILLMTMDSETREPLSEEEAQARRATAEDLLAQLQAAGDVEALFNQLVEEYGEDPGRAADSGYLVTPETSFVPEFLDAAFALKPGELSGIVESDYGYHILLRKELTEAQKANLAGEHVTDLLWERVDAGMETMTRSEKLASINPGEFYNSYIEVLQARMAAEADDAAGGAAE